MTLVFLLMFLRRTAARQDTRDNNQELTTEMIFLEKILTALINIR